MATEQDSPTSGSTFTGPLYIKKSDGTLVTVVDADGNIDAPVTTTDLTTTGNTTLGNAVTDTLTVMGASSIQSTSALALAVGRLGATTPAFQVDASAAVQVNGLKVTGSATTANVALVVVGDTAVSGLTITGKAGGAAGVLGGVLTMAGGLGNTTGAGGAVSLTGGAGGNDAVGGSATLAGGAAGGGNRAGGDAIINGGAGAGSANGGAITATGGTAGATGAGGAITLTAGIGGATSGAGGAATLAGGAATAGNSAGGQVNLTGGAGQGTSAGGAIVLTSGASENGTAVNPGASGAITLAVGAAGTATTGVGGAGGSLALTGAAGGASTGASSVGGAGSDVNITAGAGGNSSGGGDTGGAGGSIILTAGTGGTGATAGKDGVIILRGIHMVKQGTPTAKTVSATLTAAEVLAGIITVNQAAGGSSAQQLPEAATLDTALPDSAAGDAFDFSVINTSTVDAEDASVTTNTGWTLVGSMDIHAYSAAGSLNSSARFRARKTGAGAWTLYRIA